MLLDGDLFPKMAVNMMATDLSKVASVNIKVSMDVIDQTALVNEEVVVVLNGLVIIS